MPSPWWRRVRQNFGISAPRMAVRTPLPWWGRAMILCALVAIVGGMWWWGFDFGQIFGGFNRREVESRLAQLELETSKSRVEVTQLRARNTELESALAMTRGAQEGLTKQATELAGENAQLKDELAFLQKLFADSNKQVGVSIPRLSLERAGDDMWHFSLLVVRGGSPKDDFDGRMVLQIALAGDPDSASHSLTLPDDQSDTEAALRLRFKYYQRVEGTFRAPPGSRVTMLTARAFEAGSQTPRATRTLTNP